MLIQHLAFHFASTPKKFFLSIACGAFSFFVCSHSTCEAETETSNLRAFYGKLTYSYQPIQRKYLSEIRIRRGISKLFEVSLVCTTVRR